MSARFSGKTVLVTGASRGLGRAIVVAFAREGAFVAIGFKTRADAADETLAAVREAGADGVTLGFDVGEPAAVETAVRGLAGTRGQIDVAIANAGIAEDGFMTMLDHDSFDRVVRTNLAGTANTCRSAARVMAAKKKGAIVTVASVAGIAASPGQSSYAASKGGVIAMSKTLAAELAPRGIRVNCVVPGLIAAGIAARLDHRILAQKKAMIPLGRLGEADEVARAVVFLASDEASYVVGQVLVVDGGLT